MDREKTTMDRRVVVDVWDWQTRVLHWTNALLVLTLALLMLGNEAMEALGVAKALRRPVKQLHAYTGYVFVFTFTLRIAWAFLGNEYARWRDIVPLTGEQWSGVAANVRWYLSGFKSEPPLSRGHNPLASLFYTALFVVLAAQALTGLTLAGVELHMAPAAWFTAGLGEEALEAVEEAAEEIHEFGLWFVIFYLTAHIGGLVFHEIGERTGLFSSMIHGKKYFPEE